MQADKHTLIATTAFGLEATCKRELARLGYTPHRVWNGRIYFKGDDMAVARANIGLGSADRLLLCVGEFEVTSFEGLFDAVKALPCADYIPIDGAFAVIGKSVKSALYSVPDCQAIVKKAVVESLKERYKVDWFKEDGPICKVQVALNNDVATLTIDTTGEPLHRRGYRKAISQAPIKETLAYGLIELSYFRRGRPFLDPLCGSGTIAIEAAMTARNIAPGAKRRFVSESWPCFDKKVWNNARTEFGRNVIKGDLPYPIIARDKSPELIALAQENARRAGVLDDIDFAVADISSLQVAHEHGIMITKPPYGERIGNKGEIEHIYRHIAKAFPKGGTWSLNIISSDEVEKALSRKASRRRKLFNGDIKAQYYQFDGPRPTQ